MSEPLNPVQIALADGIAERVVAAIEQAQARTPLRILQQEIARACAMALQEDGSVRSLAQSGIGHNRGPPLEEQQPAVMSVPEFCSWAKLSKSTLYQMWAGGVGPKFFKAGTATRITRESAVRWLVEREAAAGAESRPLVETA